MATIRHLKTLLSALENRSCPKEEKITSLLEIGCSHFELVLGLVSDIQGTEYRVIASYPVGIIGEDDTFELGETVCDVTVSSPEPTYFTKASGTQWALHPAYDKFAIETYIGVTYKSGDHGVGTLNFSSPTALGYNFTDTDVQALELLRTSLINILKS